MLSCHSRLELSFRWLWSRHALATCLVPLLVFAWHSTHWRLRDKHGVESFLLWAVLYPMVTIAKKAIVLVFNLILATFGPSFFCGDFSLPSWCCDGLSPFAPSPLPCWGLSSFFGLDDSPFRTPQVCPPRWGQWRCHSLGIAEAPIAPTIGVLLWSRIASHLSSSYQFEALTLRTRRHISRSTIYASVPFSYCETHTPHSRDRNASLALIWASPMCWWCMPCAQSPYASAATK